MSKIGIRSTTCQDVFMDYLLWVLRCALWYETVLKLLAHTEKDWQMKASSWLSTSSDGSLKGCGDSRISMSDQADKIGLLMNPRRS